MFENWKTKFRQDRDARVEAVIRDSFAIEERGGDIYITHNGVAVEKIEKLATSDGIAGMLNVKRNNAVEYWRRCND